MHVVFFKSYRSMHVECTREDQIKPWVPLRWAAVSTSEPQLVPMHQRGSSSGSLIWFNWSEPQLNRPRSRHKCQKPGIKVAQLGPCTTVLCNTTVEAGVIIRHGRTGENTTQTIRMWRGFLRFEWGVYALSASKAIFRARTYNCITYSVRWWWLLDEWN